MTKLKAKHEKQIGKAIDQLNKTLSEIQEYIPDCNFYIEDKDNFNVMDGHSHDDNGKANCHMVLTHFTLNNSGGGGW